MGDADNHTTKTNGDSPTAVCSSSFAFFDAFWESWR